MLTTDPRIAGAILQSAFDPIVTINTCGIVESFNSAAERAFGYSAAEVIGCNINVLMPEPYCRDHDRYLQRRREQGPRSDVGFCREVSGRRKDGTTFPLEIAISEVQLDDRRVLVGVVRDVSERLRVQKTLDETEECFRLLAENIHRVFWICSADRRQVLYLSPIFEKVWGRSCQEILESPMGFLETIHPEDRPGVMAIVDSQLAGAFSGRIEEEYRIVRPDGAVRWIWTVYIPLADADGRMTRLAGISEDITERKQEAQTLQRAYEEMEIRVEQRTAELRAANERLRAEVAERRQIEMQLRENKSRLLEAHRIARLGNWEWNIAANVTHWSAEIYRIFGLEQPQSGGTYQTFLDLVHPDDRPGVEAAIDDALCNRRPYCHDYRIVRPSGEIRVIHSEAVVTFDAESRPVRMAGAVQDVTEKKRAEDQLRTQRDELAHVARLNTMGEMALQLAHELNQPLGAIGIYAESALRKLRANPPELAGAVSTMEKVVGQAHRAGQIINRLRNFVRHNKPRESTVDLHDLIGGVCEFIEPEARQNSIAIRRRLAAPSPLVQADQVQVEQVLLNLIRNGIAAMAETDADRRELIIGTSSEADGMIEVTVEDRGCGFEPSSLRMIFESFFTTKPNGMGLGLSITRSIVEAHGGRVWATPNPDRGLTMHFTLPAGKNPRHKSESRLHD